MGLPQDVSNVSCENYATAASKGGEKVSQQAPQLFCLRPTTVITEAKMFLNELRLLPALLRNEPLLLEMNSERLVGTFDTIYQTLPSSIDTIEACRRKLNLLATDCIEWNSSSLSPDDDNNATKETTMSGDERSIIGGNSMSAVENIQLLQKSFDDEFSADNLHMKPFCKIIILNMLK